MSVKGAQATLQEDAAQLVPPDFTECGVAAERERPLLNTVEAVGPKPGLATRKGNPSGQAVGRTIDNARFPVKVEQGRVCAKKRRPASVPGGETVECAEQ